MPTRWLLALAATSCAPLGLRAAALHATAGRLAPVDAFGFASDVGVSLLAAALLVALTAVHRLVAAAFALLWALVHYANYELVVVLGAPATWREARYLLDPTFAAGSATALSAPGLLALAVVATLALAHAGARAGRRGCVAAAAAGLAIVAGVSALSGGSEQPDWRRVSFLQRDVTRLLAGLRAPDPAAALDPPAAMLERHPALAADLSGAWRLPEQGAAARNVLLVVLESLSGIHLETFAREHGREADASLPVLDAFAAESLRYVSFVAHQRKTNRGLYALLCGELPNLGNGTPKMSAAAEVPWRACLPDVLRGAGYRTVYIQAAPLAFMLKDRFMAAAGFEEVRGHDWFTHSYTTSAWGVDDRAFFEQVLRRIATLRAGDSPWLLTLLNVGTHHPYTVPDDFQPGRSGRRSFRRAAAYLDGAFGRFVERLAADGVLDDTLLVVTSDESTGIAGFDTQPAFKMLSQNWGVLMLRGPGIPPGVVREPFGLLDLPLSIVDYLGLAGRAEHFHGRSVFRRYATPRHLFFGNGNLGTLGAFEPAGTLLACASDGSCRRYPVPDGRWFGVLPEPSPAAGEGAALLKDLARRSAPGAGTRPTAYALLAEPDVTLTDDRPRMLHGGQFVHLGADEWIEVEYEVEVRGDAGARVALAHSLTGHRNEGLLRRRATLGAGEKLVLAYRYAPDGPKGQLQCRTTVRRTGGGEVVLHHGAARMRIHRGGGPPPGARLDRFEVVRAGSP